MKHEKASPVEELETGLGTLAAGEATLAAGEATLAAGEATLAAAASDTTVPEIPGYRMLSQLGRGGMGVVYLVEHIALNRRVAIKVIATGGSSTATALARFRSEARAVAALTHPGVCQIYETGEIGATPYLVMEYVPGQTLAQFIRAEPPSPKLAATIAQAIAEAVDACHQAGILHRDLKPSNVMRTETGSIKVMDFGLAKRIGETDSSTTRTGEILGTPSYMAPEQASGVVKQLGPPCDVYGIGAILYEMLVGRPPHYGPDPMQTVLQVLTVEPVAPRQLQAQVPRDLETICLKCLEKQPQKRYQSAASLAEDIERFLTGRPIVARPANLFERGVKWSKRHPSTCALIASGVLAIVAMTIGVAFHLDRLQRELDRSNRLFSQSQNWGNWLVDEHIPAVAKLRGGGELQNQLVNKTLNHLQELQADSAADGKLAQFIARAYVHIADVQADPAFFTTSSLQQAVQSYQQAVSLYRHSELQSSQRAQLQLAHALVKLSHTQMQLHDLRNAVASNQDAIELLNGLLAQESIADQSTIDQVVNDQVVNEQVVNEQNVDEQTVKISLLEAQVLQVRLASLVDKSKDPLPALRDLYAECLTLSEVSTNPLLIKVQATLAMQLADCLADQSATEPIDSRNSETASTFYAVALQMLRDDVQQNEDSRLLLTLAAEKLSQALIKEQRLTEAMTSLEQAVEQQQRLVLELPESSHFQLRLLSLLHQQSVLFLSADEVAAALTVSQRFVNEAEPLYQLNPDLYAQQLLQAYAIASRAAKASGDADLALKHIIKATQVARNAATTTPSPVSQLGLANVLKVQAELKLELVNARSTVPEQFRSLQDSLAMVEESLDIYQQRGEATSSAKGSPFWLAIELKHRIESQLIEIQRLHRESAISGSTRPDSK
jgi:serine/threonine protein kinase